MKKLNVLCIAAAAIALAGCAKEKHTEAEGDTNGVLTVSIKSDKATRALIDDTNTDAVVAAFENNVYGFSAYVFSVDTGDLEAKAVSADGDPVNISGLNTAGMKRVVVIANDAEANYPTNTTGGSAIPRFVNDPNYSRFATGYLSINDQAFTDFTDLSKGFLMTGESAPIQLTAGNNTATIQVKRVVAKIELGDITFDDAVQLSDLASFDLTEAAIQRAAAYSTLAAGAVTTPTTPSPTWYGGFGLEDGSTVSAKGPDALANTKFDGTTALDGFQPYLIDLYNVKLNMGEHMGTVMGGTEDMIDVADDFPGTLASAKTTTGNAVVPFSPKGFWYVLPNSSTEKFTLLTLKGTYKGTPFYYPIEINDPDGQAEADDDSYEGNYVQRNTHYIVNIHFKNFTGVANPDLPSVAANIDVTVTVADWEGPVEQTATW